MLKRTYSPNYKDEDEDLDAVAREEREYSDDEDYEYEYEEGEDDDINEREDAMYSFYQKELERYYDWLYKDRYY